MRNAFAKIGWLSDQAKHEMAIIRKIIEVSRMDAHTGLAQQPDGEFFVTLERGNAQNNVPSALDHQPRARGMACKLEIEFRKINAQTAAKNGLDLFALIEQHGSSKLHGRVQREKGVGDDLQARSGFGNYFVRAAGSHPGKLHLR